MRDKAFDLGRVYTLIKTLHETELFAEKFWSRPKDAEDWFCNQTREKQLEVIHELAYEIQKVDWALSEIWAICAGKDDLNTPEGI